MSARRTILNSNKVGNGSIPFPSAWPVKRRSGLAPVELHYCTVRGCDFKCTRPKILLQHILKRHKEEKPFRCSFPGCSYRTRQKCSLTRHRKIHTGEKPYACTHEGCTYRCAEKSNLKIHMRIHTGEKPFACHFPGCGYRCTQRGSLQNHIRTHTGERPFPCPVEGCTYRSARKGHLKRHMKSHEKQRAKMVQLRLQHQQQQKKKMMMITDVNVSGLSSIAPLSTPTSSIIQPTLCAQIAASLATPLPAISLMGSMGSAQASPPLGCSNVEPATVLSGTSLTRTKEKHSSCRWMLI